jgi:3-oxoacyl-[acyl-carrier-protein] synthase III
MRRLLCTIGFAGKTAEQFFALLHDAGVQAVIDVRQNRGGQLSAFAKYPDLEYFLREIVHVGYQHELLLAPSPEIRTRYREDKDWSAYEAAFLNLMKERGVPQALETSSWPAKIALLCTEPGAEKCHRRLVAELLADHWRAEGDEVEIRHLASKPRKQSKASEVSEVPHATEILLRSAAQVGAFRGAASAKGFAGVAAITGSAVALGSRCVASEEVDRAFGMPAGKLRNRAGIESVAYVVEGESELTLGAAALRQALDIARSDAKEIDWMIATSETHRGYPALAAQLHKRLALRENCAALDVGGACLGLLNALAVGQSLIKSGQARSIAIVTADVHSQTLKPGVVAGEFGGLFGDGASAFILRAGSDQPVAVQADTGEYQLGKFLFGCASQYAEAISVRDDQQGGLAVRFDGEALSRAAITRMERMIAAVEINSGISRASVGAFATHQPNPRLVTLLAKQCNVPAETFPAVARTSGNLGSSTCGAALHAALRAASKVANAARKPIFLASLGPGLLVGGSWLAP